MRSCPGILPKNACADVVLKWKDVSENVDEFLEIRQIAT